MAGDLGMTTTQNSHCRRIAAGLTVAFLVSVLGTKAVWGANQNSVLQTPAPHLPTPPHTAAQPQSSHSQCPPLDRAGLRRLLEASPEKELQLVFFSSWCSECAVHLKNLNNPSAVLIGTFDKQPRIEKVVGKMKLSNLCFTDAGIGKILDIKTVPNERRVTLESLHKSR
jgi:hypothetical protein